MTANPKDIELKIQWLFARLLEKDNRGYTAIESARLGQGGRERLIERVDGNFMMKLDWVILKTAV